MRLFQKILKKPDNDLSNEKQTESASSQANLINGHPSTHQTGDAEFNNGSVRTIACLLLIMPIICLLLILLASSSLVLSDIPTTFRETSWDEHLLRFVHNYELDQCSKIAEYEKIDCMPVGSVDEKTCTQRKCCWNPQAESDYDTDVRIGIPWCYYPNQYGGYSSDKAVQTKTGFSVDMHRSFKTIFHEDVQTVKMDFKFETQNRLHVKLTDPKKKRYECPFPEVPEFNGPASREQLYSVEVKEKSSGFNVIRKETTTSIFSALDVGDLVYSDQYLEISAILPKGTSIYGLGEHQGPLKINNNDWNVITMFNGDVPPAENKNLYGTHPFYLAIEPSGHSHGFFLLNSNAMDFIINPNPTITIRTIGGILDMYFFFGPTPAEVVRQYSEIVGKPIMPPFWALGFHLSKFGYNSLNRTKQIWQQTRDANIPFDVQWNDIDYMDKANDFTYDKEKFAGLPDFVNKLHEVGMHYVPIIDSGVSASEPAGTYPPFDEGIKRDIFIKDSKGKPFVGKVWNRASTVWPDYTNPKALTYWVDMIKSFHQEVAFDGLWIDMNEPSNFYSGTIKGCPKSPLERPQYTPHVEGGILSHKTVCMTAKQYLGNHYDVHNLVGMAEAIATSFALSEVRGKRPLVISRSTFAGHGKFASHWTGDVASTWHDLKMSIPQMLNFNMFQIPLVGADICGFNGNTTAELCRRWHQLGAFYPFARNHNTDDGIDQDPVSLGTEVVSAARENLVFRYMFLPYLYTLFYKAHVTGDPVARPLFFEFYSDKKTHAIDEQFLWGKWLMIVPVLKEGVNAVDAYVPKGVWYDFPKMERLNASGSTVTLAASDDLIPLLLRGGGILPFNALDLRPVISLTTTKTRQGPLGLLVAPDSLQRASGELFWDDGDSLDSIDEGKYSFIAFKLEKNLLTARPTHWGYDEIPKLRNVVILNVLARPDQVRLNGTVVDKVDYSDKSKRLDVELDVTLRTAFNLEWTT